MSRAPKRIHGSGTGGVFVADTDEFKEASGYTPLRDSIDAVLGALFQTNVPLGGSEVTGIKAEATGDSVVLDWVPWLVQNANSQMSGFSDAPPSGSAAAFVAQVRMFLRVSNAGITITPKVWYGSTMGAITTAATISGTAACSATNDDYSGSNQIQTVTITLPAGTKYLKLGFTVAGTPAAGYEAWARGWGDAYVVLP